MDFPIPQPSILARLLKRRTRLIAAAILAGISLFAWLGSTQLFAAGDADWLTLEHGTVFDTAIGSGSFSSRQQRSVSADETGVVERIEHQPGEAVQAGALLFSLRNAQLVQEAETASIEAQRASLDYAATLETIEHESQDARIALQQAQIDLQVAQADQAAHQALLEKQIISKLRYQQIEALALKARNSQAAAEERLRMQSARGQRLLEIAKQSLQLSTLKAKRAQERLGGLQIRAPRAGLVKKIGVQLGDAVLPGRPLAEVGPLVADGARIRVPQRELSRLSVNLPVGLRFNEQQVEGNITRIEPDPHDGMVTLEVAADLPDSARIDMAVQAEVRFGAFPQVSFVRSLRSLEAGQTTLTLMRQRAGRQLAPVSTPVRALNGYLVFPQLDWQPGDRIALVRQ